MSAPPAPPGLPPALERVRERGRDAALFLDYDGTMAPIVADPAGARPVAAVPELLERLAARLGLVAVVSGRPVGFLADTLRRPKGVHLAGVYGMEEVGADGSSSLAPGAEQWRGAVERVARAAVASAPPGAEVEDKGLALALHWRRAPDAETWARAVADDEGGRAGLVAQPGRMAIELRPPLDIDKGTVVRRLAVGYPVVACFGDDVGDLPAFRVLADLERHGVEVARVVVADAESPNELVGMADVVVQGPDEAVAMLEALAR